MRTLIFLVGILSTNFMFGQKDDPVRMELAFTLRALPDNGWFLFLHEDGTYAYKHWSGFGEPEGYILEQGTYQMVNDEIIFDCTKGSCQLAESKYFLSKTDQSDLNIVKRLDRTKTYELRVVNHY